MEIIAWNIRCGGGKRRRGIVDELCRRNPEVIVLGEYIPGTSGALIQELKEAGWVYHALSQPPTRYGGVAVLSKCELVQKSLPVEFAPFAFRYIAVEMPKVHLHLRAVYGPLHKDPYDDFWNAVLDSLRDESANDVLLIGDLNAGLSHSDAPVANFFCSNYLSELSTHGYKDFWREKHGPDAREYTWRGKVNPYRLDHAFGTATLSSRLLECHYDHTVRESKLSDHSLMVVKLAPKPGKRSGITAFTVARVSRFTNEGYPQLQIDFTEPDMPAAIIGTDARLWLQQRGFNVVFLGADFENLISWTHPDGRIFKGVTDDSEIVAVTKTFLNELDERERKSP